jgi:hypothetical protein
MQGRPASGSDKPTDKPTSGSNSLPITPGDLHHPGVIRVSCEQPISRARGAKCLPRPTIPRGYSDVGSKSSCPVWWHIICPLRAVIDTAGLEAVDARARPIKSAQSEPSDRKEHQRPSRASKSRNLLADRLAAECFAGAKSWSEWQDLNLRPRTYRSNAGGLSPGLRRSATQLRRGRSDDGNRCHEDRRACEGGRAGPREAMHRRDGGFG